MLKKLNKRNRIIYWVTTLFFVLFIINSFLEKEVKTKRDLIYKEIIVKKIQNIRHPKGQGKSLAIIDTKSDEFRVTLKLKNCLTHDLKNKLYPNDVITVGYIKDFSFTRFFLPYYEINSISKNETDYIDFKCVTNESHFGKWKLSLILIVLNVIMLYLLTITQKTTKTE